MHILEAVSTPRERHWSSTLEELAHGAADQWFDSGSPALIMIGQALSSAQVTLERFSTEVDNSLQNSFILANGQRRA